MRPSRDKTFIEIARVLAERGTCGRRKVGCVLVNVFGHIIGSGYNGPANGLDHCTDKPCPGATHSSGSGTSLYLCEAVHAEQNALLQCRDVREIDTCYVTTSPCVQCTKLLMQTTCRKIVFVMPSSHDIDAKALWFKNNYAEEWRMIDE